MPADATTDPEFEIGHVLFIDIVGYSKLLIGEQSEVVRELKEVVATSEQVRVAEEARQIALITNWRRRRVGFSRQRRSACAVRARDRPRGEEVSEAATADGDS